MSSKVKNIRNRKNGFHHRFYLWCLILLIFIVGSLNAHSFFSSNNGNKNWNNVINRMMTVDPSKIVALMIKHGGLLVSKEIDQDLKLLANVCHAEECLLNIAEKQLLIRNFSVQLPSDDEVITNPALHINRVFLKWDSYLKPTVEIQVDDIHVLVEFYNLILTKNNWDKLKKLGFPPAFEEYSSTTTTDQADSAFLRIGSIDLSGGINLILSSQTLSKQIASLTFDLDKLDPLDREIRNQADANLANAGRKGCTTTEIYSIIQAYFERIIKDIVTEVVGDLVVDGGTQTKETANRLFGLTKASVSKYIEEAGGYTGEQAGKELSKRIEALGDSLGKLEQNHKNVFQFAKSISKSKLIKDLLEEEIYKDVSSPDAEL